MFYKKTSLTDLFKSSGYSHLVPKGTPFWIALLRIHVLRQLVFLIIDTYYRTHVSPQESHCDRS